GSRCMGPRGHAGTGAGRPSRVLRLSPVMESGGMATDVPRLRWPSVRALVFPARHGGTSRATRRCRARGANDSRAAAERPQGSGRCRLSRVQAWSTDPAKKIGAAGVLTWSRPISFVNARVVLPDGVASSFRFGAKVIDIDV